MRDEIERALGLQALDIYGLSEVMGPGVSMESAEDHDGLFIWEDHFYPEVIDPQSGEVLPYGEEGELVFTVGDEEVVAGPGTFLLVPPGVRHDFSNRTDALARFVNVHAPAGFDVRLESD